MSPKAGPTLFLFLLLAMPALGAKGKAPAGGVLEGRITVTAPPRKEAPDRAGSGRYGFRDRERSAASVRREPLPEEIVVYLEDVPGRYAPPKEHAELNQKYLQFTRRILPVLKGTTVDFTNNDPVYHNVFSNSRINSFDLGRKRRGASSRVVLKRPEVPVQVYCEIHSSMKSSILVLENPFFTTVEPGGEFRLEGVPPGSYSLVAWHDHWKPVRRKVKVMKDRVLRVDVVMDRIRE